MIDSDRASSRYDVYSSPSIPPNYSTTVRTRSLSEAVEKMRLNKTLEGSCSSSQFAEDEGR